jgi:hypothetical protein
MADRDLRALDMRHTLPNLKNLLLTLTNGEGARLTSVYTLFHSIFAYSQIRCTGRGVPLIRQATPSRAWFHHAQNLLLPSRLHQAARKMCWSVSRLKCLGAKRWQGMRPMHQHPASSPFEGRYWDSLRWVSFVRVTPHPRID